MNTAKIRITDLVLKTLIGCHAAERIEKQTILVNIEMVVDISKAIETDHIDDTVNYDTLSKIIVSEGETYANSRQRE